MTLSALASISPTSDVHVVLEVNGEPFEYHGDWPGATAFLFALRVYFAMEHETPTVD